MGDDDMKHSLKKILLLLEEEYKDNIEKDARNYLEVNLGRKAELLGLDDIKEHVKSSCAVIPIKTPAEGMKVRIDGRTFVNYGQFDSGIAAPGYVAEVSGMPYKTYVAKDSMILNFA